jgi:mannose-6-phosphate isomerase-like protein (cupin superfamily)
MSTNPSSFFRQPGEGPAMNVIGSTHIYKALSAETGGAFSLWELIVPPGHGAPPHVHSREDEAFYLLSGELTVELDGKPHQVGPGGFFFAGRGRQHAFRNTSSQEARALVLCAPGAGLEAMFGELDAATRKSEGMPPLETIRAITGRADVVLAA